MGEAKRRKQLDPTYGKVPLLSSQGQREKHLSLLLEQLFGQFDSDLKHLAEAETETASNYNQIKNKLSAWLNDKLAEYRSCDRTEIAGSLLAFCAEMTEEYVNSPLFLKCFSEALLPFFPDEKRLELEKIIQQIDTDLAAASSI